MNARGMQGFTLVEVIASLVLLSAMGLAVLPLLLQVHRTGKAVAHSVDVFDLQSLGASLVEKPQTFGFETLPESAELSWPTHPERPKLRLKLHRSSDALFPHAWISLSCDGLVVHRFLPLSKELEHP